MLFSCSSRNVLKSFEFGIKVVGFFLFVSHIHIGLQISVLQWLHKTLQQIAAQIIFSMQTYPKNKLNVKYPFIFYHAHKIQLWIPHMVIANHGTQGLYGYNAEYLSIIILCIIAKG